MHSGDSSALPGTEPSAQSRAGMDSPEPLESQSSRRFFSPSGSSGSSPWASNAEVVRVDELIGYVEVRWRDRTEPVCFVLPREHLSLPQSTKVQFLDRVDLSTTEKRMKELVEVSGDMAFEMSWLYKINNNSWSYRNTKRHLKMFRIVLYMMVVLLNINMLLDHEGKEFGSTLKGLLHGKVGDTIAFIICLVIIAGYAVVTVFDSITAIPVLNNKMGRDVQTQMLQGVTRRKLGVFKYSVMSMSFYWLFVCLHAVYFPYRQWYYR